MEDLDRYPQGLYVFTRAALPLVHNPNRQYSVYTQVLFLNILLNNFVHHGQFVSLVCLCIVSVFVHLPPPKRGHPVPSLLCGSPASSDPHPYASELCRLPSPPWQPRSLHQAHYVFIIIDKFFCSWGGGGLTRHCHGAKSSRGRYTETAKISYTEHGLAILKICAELCKRSWKPCQQHGVPVLQDCQITDALICNIHEPTQQKSL